MNLNFPLRHPVQLAVLLTGCLAAAAAINQPARAQDELSDPDLSLKLYAVHIIQTPPETRTGNGVYLGNGLILTAAHVAARTFWKKNEIEISGKQFAARVLKHGAFPHLDLALLSIDEQLLPVSLRLRRMPLCGNSPLPNEEVIVATPENIARSRVMPPSQLPKGLDSSRRTAIRDVASTGNSGSGVFDANKKCLLGIISAKITGSNPSLQDAYLRRKTFDIGKYFVPAAVIANFIRPEYRN